MTMKPIETIYKNYRLRSRLEARWAVFFDTLGVKWEYEKEGYDLDGVWYLPDFWLPSLGYWFEVKGKHPTREERQKSMKLAIGSGKPVYLFAGDIEAGMTGTRFYDFCEDDLCVWARCDLCHNIKIPWIRDEAEWKCSKGHPNRLFSDGLEKAYIAARQARFEHGEGIHG